MQKRRKTVAPTGSFAVVAAGGAQPGDDDDDEKLSKMAARAVEKMRYCSKASLYSVVAGLFVDVVNARKRTLGPFEALAEGVDKIAGVGFAVGLWQAARIYGRLYEDGDVDDARGLRLCRTLSGVWLRAAISLFVSTALLAFTELSQNRKNVGVAFVAGLWIAGGAAASFLSRDTIRRRCEGRPPATTKEGGDADIRRAGLQVVCNMVLCAVGFGVLGLTHLATNLASPAGLVEKALEMPDVVQWFILGGLLTRLSQCFLGGLVNATSDKKDSEDAATGAFHELLDTQASVYGKIGKILASFATFSLLPILWLALKALLPISIVAKLPF